MTKPVVHFEINVPDNEPLIPFYSELFGWHLQSMPEMGYALVDTHAGGGINGGIGKAQSGKAAVTFYVHVDDLDATLQKAASLGGKTVVPVTEIPNVVTFAQFADPQGNVIGIVGGGEGEGPGVSPGDNPAVDWFEILGPDPKALWTFYSALFGWKISEGGGETGGQQYIYGEVEAAKGGIPGGSGSGPQGEPHVTVYIRVDDLQKYLERAETLGGKTRMGPMPVGEGLTVAAFTDPQGAVIGLYTMQK